MATEVEICNLALTQVGNAQFIESLDDDSDESALCKLWYPISRDAVLEAFEWPFATQRVQLATSSVAPVGPWAYRYLYPQGVLLVRRIDSGVDPETADVAIPFRLEGDGVTRTLLTNQPEAVVVVTLAVTNTVRFSALFVTALVGELASRLVMPLRKDARVAEVQDRRSARDVLLARAAHAGEQTQGRRPDNSFKRSRS